MKRFLSRLLALVMVMSIALVGCSPAGGLTGNYRDDTLTVINTLKTAITLPADSPNRAAAQADARKLMNDFASRYRRDSALTKLSSFTTMRTAVNSLAGHYSSYPNRPVPQKMVDRLTTEFNQVETFLKRGN
ncbi:MULTISPECIES: photosystem II protein Psb27 [Leptolyngbya]|jgi:photosystem II Psb27 protein|uniref:Photosystem II lipoprotein Psb27 n=2 Tax=Leptolyngbya boryana TaxID=1184 RepID=A0A1Z4JGG7_LEPBY|nr:MULTISPECIES: photosystem II protein Psb27 [Leptolyngbya]BAY55607.1 photosystem II 11 kD protein [Leptolyngbya boryana NIES-2135]MBD1854604.1 photosystem II protein Psb27 [Leptolyngbya sp. FACHB-1624]MBD2369967.1 photosystem II protein Psb27 [Leptolyngbya sp. FACHB-161]MBD2376331.1 photosystem II protein Psb27 [Leptolyngbya sp. FACHB-238]MBD2400606.1 photosystem II protein Psb27 [Leptolyngbya sp. FACHB-239]